MRWLKRRKQQMMPAPNSSALVCASPKVGLYRRSEKLTWAPASAARVRISSTLNNRSEEHTSELQSLMRISYAVFCLTKTTEASSLHSLEAGSTALPATHRIGTT